MTIMDLGNQQHQPEHKNVQGKTDDLARRIEQENTTAMGLRCDDLI